MILIDSNILIDVLEKGQDWFDWSMDQLVTLGADHRLAVNQIAFAEVAPRMGDIQAFQGRLSEFEIVYEPLDLDASYCAGLAFLDYRKRRTGAQIVLPDFMIGGHAEVAQASVLTRDPRFYRAYFPTVPLITPDKADT